MWVRAWLIVIVGVGFASTGRVKPRCCMIWFIHILCSCTDIVCKSWLDNGVCGIVFMGVRLLIEGMVDTISVDECENRVI